MYYCEAIPSESFLTCFYFACWMKENSLAKDFQGKVHDLKNEVPKTTWVLNCSLRTYEDKLIIEYPKDKSTSLHIKGDYVFSVCAVSETSLLIPLENILLITINLEVVH